MAHEQIYDQLEEIQEELKGLLFCISCNKNNLESLSVIELMTEKIKNDVYYLYTELDN